MTITQAQWFWLAFLIVVVAMVNVHEVWQWTSTGIDGTLSRVCRFCFDRFPFLFVTAVFAVGLIIGHVGFPTRP
jgi:hypothetical protein